MVHYTKKDIIVGLWCINPSLSLSAVKTWALDYRENDMVR